MRLVPYTPEWPCLFVQERARLQAAVGGAILDIQHVGSTSIPGMVAKPILDIGIAVVSFEEAYICVPRIERLGYEYEGENGIPRRHYFVRRNPHTTHHVHMHEPGSPAWENLILFRDYLIRHPELAQEYAALKLELAQRFAHDRPRYTDEKGPFVQRVLSMARLR